MGDFTVPSWNAYSYAFGPLLAFGGVGVLVLILRWAFRRGSSVVAAPPRIGNPDDFGLLIPIARPDTYIDGEILRRRLETAGIKANLAQTLDGPRVLVWPADVDRARALIGMTH